MGLAWKGGAAQGEKAGGRVGAHGEGLANEGRSEARAMQGGLARGT